VSFPSADFIGGVAGTLTTIAFIPQLIKAWRTQSVEDLSIWMLLTFTTGVVLWTIFGVMTRSRPVIAANGVTCVLALMLLAMKLRAR
jgi:MtN3 and saliva related transmembrane protein